MPQPIYQVDAFADRPFAGNPAAVCPLEKPRDAEWMQQVATEMNLAETAFIVRRNDGSYDLRWFTPAVEVDLCGHATLATAHTLWETNRLKPDEPARFHTRSGLLTCVRGSDGWIQMDFPATPQQRADAPDGMFDAMSLSSSDVLTIGKTKFDYLVQIRSETQLRTLSPDHSRLRKLPVRGIIVTAQPSGSSEFDFVSRFFAPGSGIDEDPVTGSAHCALGPYWALKLGKTELVGYQASQRGGVVRVTLQGDRVLLAGQAVTTMRGELTC
jgi:PhzF family phenazine biosynthesis protein